MSRRYVCTKRATAVVRALFPNLATEARCKLLEVIECSSLPISGAEILHGLRHLPAPMQAAAQMQFHAAVSEAGVVVDADRIENSASSVDHVFKRIRRDQFLWLVARLQTYLQEQIQLKILHLFSFGDLNHDALMQPDEFRRLVTQLSGSSAEIKATVPRDIWAAMRSQCPFLKEDLVRVCHSEPTS